MYGFELLGYLQVTFLKSRYVPGNRQAFSLAFSYWREISKGLSRVSRGIIAGSTVTTSQTTLKLASAGSWALGYRDLALWVEIEGGHSCIVVLWLD